MNPLSISAAKPAAFRLPAGSAFNPHRRFLSGSFSSLAVRFPCQPLPLSSLASIRASTQNAIRGDPGKSLKFQKFQFSDGNSAPEMSSLGALKAGVITAITAAALFFVGFAFPVKSSIATPLSASVSVEEKETLLEEQLLTNPNDVDALKNLMEIKIKTDRIPEAIEVIDRLIEVDPDETEWPLMRSHLYAQIDDLASAKEGFNELLNKDPYHVEAYHGLVIVASQNESIPEEMANVEKMVHEAIALCRKENKITQLRDFKLLLAQIRVLQGRYEESLKVYDELVNQEPRDFRPYLCKGIIYTLLKKEKEADQNFEKYKRLIPRGHPLASYFQDNMIASKLFAQKVKNEGAMAKS